MALVIGSKLSGVNKLCMKLKVIAKKREQKLCLVSELTFMPSNLQETGLYEGVSLAQIHFLLCLCDQSPAYEISH